MTEKRKSSREVRFTVASISCVACTPAFRNGLKKSPGIGTVREFPMMNRVVVEFDPAMTSEDHVKEMISKVADRAGYGGRVIFSEKERG